MALTAAPISDAVIVSKFIVTDYLIWQAHSRRWQSVVPADPNCFQPRPNSPLSLSGPRYRPARVQPRFQCLIASLRYVRALSTIVFRLFASSSIRVMHFWHRCFEVSSCGPGKLKKSLLARLQLHTRGIRAQKGGASTVEFSVRDRKKRTVRANSSKLISQ